jgi:hypothetical protein
MSASETVIPARSPISPDANGVTLAAEVLA